MRRRTSTRYGSNACQFAGRKPHHRLHQPRGCQPSGSREKVDAILTATGKTSIRQRELPAHLVVYYVIALALYMQSSYREVLRCLLEGIQWLTKPNETIQATGKSGISQARSRLGAEPWATL